jgi:hypothetical protein
VMALRVALPRMEIRTDLSGQLAKGGRPNRSLIEYVRDLAMSLTHREVRLWEDCYVQIPQTCAFIPQHSSISVRSQCRLVKSYWFQTYFIKISK